MHKSCLVLALSSLSASCVIHKHQEPMPPKPAAGATESGQSDPGMPAFAAEEAKSRPATRMLSLRLGESEIDDFDDTDTEDQFTAGLDFLYRPQFTNMGVEAGVLFTGNTEEDTGLLAGAGPETVDEITHSTAELYAGLRLMPVHSRAIDTYLGIGVTLISVAESSESSTGADADDEDTTVGAYARIGFSVPIDPMTIGVDFRSVRFTEVDLDTRVASQRVDDVDSEQVTLFVGWSF